MGSVQGIRSPTRLVSYLLPVVYVAIFRGIVPRHCAQAYKIETKVSGNVQPTSFLVHSQGVPFSRKLWRAAANGDSFLRNYIEYVQVQTLGILYTVGILVRTNSSK